MHLVKKKTINNMSVPTLSYSEDWLPVKQIMNGMILTDDGDYVTGVKDYEFWLIVADRPVDLNVYLANLQIMYNKNNDGYTRRMIMQDINKANSFMSSEYNVVDTEYYIIFKEKKMELVQKKLHQLISNLANCGLNSMQTSNDDLRMLLDNFLNGGNKTTFGSVMG